jgi:hypothetical protein
VTLTDGTVVDLTDLVAFADGFYSLRRPLTEADCRRLVAEEYKVLNNIVGAHKKLIYDAVREDRTDRGDDDALLPPHPPAARRLRPGSARSSKHSAARQRASSSERTPSSTSRRPRGTFEPALRQAGHGHVARRGLGGRGRRRAVRRERASSGSRPIARSSSAARRRISRSTPPTASTPTRWLVTVASTTDELAIIFRDTSISDKLGFQYQGGTGGRTSADFLESLRKHAPDYGDERLLSIILDGENAWEWYLLDDDAKGFLNGMYTALTEGPGRVDEFRTVTVSEYLSGNAARGSRRTRRTTCPSSSRCSRARGSPGASRRGSAKTKRTSRGTTSPRSARISRGFELPGTRPPEPRREPRRPNTPRSGMPSRRGSPCTPPRAATGSGGTAADQTAGGGDEPFDRIYIELLKSVYRHAAAWGIATTVPDLVPILRYCAPSRGAMTPPTVDGRFDPDDGHEPSKPNEWTQKGSGACMDVDTGVGTNPDDVIRTFYHGQDASNVYLALRLSSDASTRLHGDWSLRLYLSHRHIEALGPPVVLQSDPNLATTRLGGAITMQAGGSSARAGAVLRWGGGSPERDVGRGERGRLAARVGERRGFGRVAGRRARVGHSEEHAQLPAGRSARDVGDHRFRGH